MCCSSRPHQLPSRDYPDRTAIRGGVGRCRRPFARSATRNISLGDASARSAAPSLARADRSRKSASSETALYLHWFGPWIHYVLLCADAGVDGLLRAEGRQRRFSGRLPAESDPATSRVALAAVGKLAVEAGEQRRILIECDSRTSIDLQCVAPGARTVNREQRAWYRHE